MYFGTLTGSYVCLLQYDFVMWVCLTILNNEFLWIKPTTVWICFGVPKIWDDWIPQNIPKITFPTEVDKDCMHYCLDLLGAWYSISFVIPMPSHHPIPNTCPLLSWNHRSPLIRRSSWLSSASYHQTIHRTLVLTICQMLPETAVFKCYSRLILFAGESKNVSYHYPKSDRWVGQYKPKTS